MQKQIIDDMLEELKGATFVGIDTLTNVKLPGGKKNELQGRVTKKVTGSRVMCFSNQKGSAYAKMVERRLEREGSDAANFKLKPRSWGERIKGTPYAEHKGNYYLEVIFLHAGVVEYLLDGEAVDDSAALGIPDRKEPTGQGGLTDQVIIRTYALESITGLRAFGQEA